MDKESEMLFRLGEMDIKSEYLIYKNAFNFLVNRYLYNMKLADAEKDLEEWAKVKRKFVYECLFDSLESQINLYREHDEIFGNKKLYEDEHDLRCKYFYLPLYNYFKEKNND